MAFMGGSTLMPSKALAAIESNDPKLPEINLNKSSSFQMNPMKYATGIAEAMKKNTSVKKLDLGSCGISTQNAMEFAEMLKVNKTLTHLNLEKNKIGTDGIEAILAALKDNETLEELNLLNNSGRIGEQALTALCVSLETNVTLKNVIWRLDSRQAWKITKMLSRNKEIERRLAQGKSVEDIHPKYRAEFDASKAAEENRAAVAAYQASQEPIASGSTGPKDAAAEIAAAEKQAKSKEAEEAAKKAEEEAAAKKAEEAAAAKKAEEAAAAAKKAEEAAAAAKKAEEAAAAAKRAEEAAAAAKRAEEAAAATKKAEEAAAAAKKAEEAAAAAKKAEAEKKAAEDSRPTFERQLSLAEKEMAEAEEKEKERENELAAQRAAALAAAEKKEAENKTVAATPISTTPSAAPAKATTTTSTTTTSISGSFNRRSSSTTTSTSGSRNIGGKDISVISAKRIPSHAVALLDANAAEYKAVELTNNSLMQMKADEYGVQIAKALAKNSVVTRVTVSKCNLSVHSAKAFADALAVNKSIKYLDLSNNRIDSDGVEAIVTALKNNESLEELNLIGQPHRIGESALTALCNSLERNIALKKIVWRLDSRQAWKITKMLSRNKEIERRIAQGKPIDDILPDCRK